MLKRIENKRYADNRYFWVHDTKQTLLAHPSRKQAIGKYDIELKNTNGTKNNVAKGGSFVEYF